MLADGENDIKAGITVGCRAILLTENDEFVNYDNEEIEIVDSVLDFTEKYLLGLFKTFSLMYQ